jgi:hypothetical protein
MNHLLLLQIIDFLVLITYLEIQLPAFQILQS